MLIPSNKFSLKFSKIGDNWGFGTSLTAVKLFEAECDNINPFAIIHTMENLGNLSNRKRRNFPAPAKLAGMHQDQKWVLFRKRFENFDDIFNRLASSRHWTCQFCNTFSCHFLPPIRLLLTLPSRLYRVGGLVPWNNKIDRKKQNIKPKLWDLYEFVP